MKTLNKKQTNAAVVLFEAAELFRQSINKGGFAIVYAENEKSGEVVISATKEGAKPLLDLIKQLES